MRTRALVWMVAVAAVLPYLDALPADFTFDDAGVIRDNAAVQVLPARALLTYVYEPGALYRPVTMLTYAANATVSADPFGFHLVNVVLHALVAAALFFLALRLFSCDSARTPAGLDRFAALLCAVLFAAHPIHTEAVTNVVGRAELLAALGVLVSLLAFARGLTPNRHRVAWMALAVAAFAAAMLAKESAFTALGLVAVMHWWMRRGAPLRDRTAALLPYLVAAAAYLAVRVAVVGALGLREPPGALDNPLAHVDVWTRGRTATVVLWEYAAQLFAPVHLSADYSYAQIPLALAWDDPRFLLAVATLASIAVGLAAAAHRAPALGVAALFTAIPLAMTANLAFPIGTIRAERLLYLPSVGWCLGFGWIAAVAARRRTVWAVAVAAVIAAYGGRTWARNLDWRDEPTLFAAMIASAPDSAKAHHNYAVALQRAGALGAAEVEYREALRIYPDYAGAAFGIGTVRRLRGDDAGAVAWYEDAIRRDPLFVEAHMQIALVRYARGEYDSAEAACRSGLASDPNDLLLLAQFSAVRLSQGDPWESRGVLERLDRLGTIDADQRELVAAVRHEVEAALP